MDVYLNRTLELGQKVPYGACDFELQIPAHLFYVGNPSRPGASFPVKLKATVFCGETEVLNLVAEVQPSTKALDLGYVLKYQPGIGPQEPDRILAYMGSLVQSDPVGELTYSASGAYLEDREVQVAYEHQRRGIATAMYQQAEALTGKQFLSRVGEVLPVDAAAFWACTDRPFGVDALYSQPRRLLWVNLNDLLPSALKDLPKVVFDAERFSLSATGKRCIETANSGAGLRGGLQDARMRGLMARGVDGIVQSFVQDPHAAPKLFRAVNCSPDPALLALCNNKGLPDGLVNPPLAVLTPESREDVMQCIGRHLHALAELDALDALYSEVRTLDRVRRLRHERGDPASIERMLQSHRLQAVSVMTDMLEKEAEFRASQM